MHQGRAPGRCWGQARPRRAGGCPPELVFRSSALVFHRSEDLGLPGSPQDAEEEMCHCMVVSPARLIRDLLSDTPQNRIHIGQTMMWVLAAGTRGGSSPGPGKAADVQVPQRMAGWRYEAIAD